MDRAAVVRWGALLALLALAGCGGSKGDRLFRIPSPAMVPTLKVGSEVSVDVDAYKSDEPRRGDIVVFHPPTGADTHQCGAPHPENQACSRPTTTSSQATFIKRVVGLPGDQLFFRDNRTYVNGRPASEPYVNPATGCDVLCNLPKPIAVPPGHYFMLGDNRGESDDSRDWGPVPRDALIGKVVAKE